MNDIIAHLTRQAVFSRATFGPGARTNGVLDHMEKEIAEVRKELNKPHPNGLIDEKSNLEGVAKEQVDLVILALDGLIRSIWAIYPTAIADNIAAIAWSMVIAKQAKNELRDWPDWRTADPNKAIEHVRGTHD